MADRSALRLDLCRPRVLRWLLHQPWLPVAFQALALAGLLALLVNGWGLGLDKSESELLTLRKTNLTTLVVWGIWWPSMILIAIGLGRAWCTVCPLELTSRIARWIGRRHGWTTRPVPRLARAGWFVVAAYLVLQVLVAGASIHRVPHATSLVLLALLAAAAAVGLVMREERAFCKALCPAKALLSVYARFTPIQLDIRSPETCAACTTRDCVSAQHRDRFDHRSCPSLVRPFARQPGDECVLCLQCAKVCPHENIGLGVVAPWVRSRRAQLLAPAEATFVALATGFVAHEVIGEAGTLEPLFHWMPESLAAIVPAIGFGWWEAFWFLALFPMALWTTVWGLSMLAAPRRNPRNLWLASATAAAPIVAIAHAGKALAKLASWAGYLPGAFGDPRGLRTLDAVMGGASTAPPPLVALRALGWGMLAAVVVIAWRSRRTLREVATEYPVAATLASTVVVVLYSIVFVVWAW